LLSASTFLRRTHQVGEGDSGLGGRSLYAADDLEFGSRISS
jgi:hypothetical protein